MKQKTRKICIMLFSWAAIAALPFSIQLPSHAAGMAAIKLADRSSLTVEVDGNPASAEQLAWSKQGDAYTMTLAGEQRIFFEQTAPVFYQPLTALQGDADGDGQQDLVIVWQEEASGGAVRYWLVKGGQAPRLTYQSEEYLQGQVTLAQEGLAISYSVFDQGDAEAFPSRRVTERWGGEPWHKLSQTETAVGRIAMAAEAKNSKNPPLHEVERMLEEAAAKYNIPAVILKAIAWQESNWRQFDANGKPLISYDGGIGIMQLTNQTRFDQARLKTDIRYNIEAGAQVLLEKRALTRSGRLPAIGSMKMDEMESWYFAIWAYNGWSAYNNPHNIPNKYRKTAAYQDSVISLARSYFAQPITRIPKEWIPRESVPSGKTTYTTPLPIHKAGEDLERRHIREGDTVEVAGFTTALNVRQSPGLNGRITDTLAMRERAGVVDGPIERDGYLWYKVKSKDGTGWVAGHYLNAVRDERISLAEVMAQTPDRLSDEAIREDGRNLYLQGDGMNLAWKNLLQNGGASAALQAYAWQDLWLEWTAAKKGDKPPKKRGIGYLRELSPGWQASNVSPTRPITLRLDPDKGPSAGTDDFLVLDSRGREASTVESSTTAGAWTISPRTSWKPAESYTLYFRALPIAAFTVAKQAGVSLEGFEVYPQVDNEIPLTKSIEIGFTQKMDAKTVSERNVWLEDEEGNVVKTTVSLSKDKRSITVKPSKPLRPDSYYFCKITTGLRSEKGKALKTNTVYVFRTAQR
ncbi:SH3 domain-containing protein [Brevibacillus sp. SYP-B805]|uniref:Ig-like domain-containing protein n=1 Tax=Brevibacillus sp. SYP-B805 TaxID=1578199 RepID=UPI0013EC9DF5|nr:Ig-like domain-containing protein [Brevibacillus sp. SYP-B805]NGQ94775.1 SH3 domain-containing protein [Brevibacillus sp. SYP-B805]